MKFCTFALKILSSSSTSSLWALQLSSLESLKISQYGKEEFSTCTADLAGVILQSVLDESYVANVHIPQLAPPSCSPDGKVQV